MNREQLKTIRQQLALSKARSPGTSPPSRATLGAPLHQPTQRASALSFAEQVGKVSPLKSARRVEPDTSRRPAPVPVQRQLDEQAALREALSDDFDVETLLETDGELSFCRPDIGADVPRKLRRGVWTSQATIDLHGLTRDEARDALASFLAEAVRQGLRCVRVVHGKGSGSPGRVPVLKGKVRGWLVQHQHVLAFVQAPRAQGGHGAVLVLLAG